jgi:hypothetical protein
MNERIRLLAEQAFFDDASSQPSDRVYTFSDHKMQQFAELIVRECAEIADEGYGSDHFGNGIAGYQLLKHFGIEE